jgi:DNA-binding LytR/AlgR family response regulator
VKDKRIITYSTLKNICESLPKTNFIQTHKSYIISIKHIDKIDNDSIWINEKELPIGNTYRKLFFETIVNNKL